MKNNLSKVYKLGEASVSEPVLLNFVSPLILSEHEENRGGSEIENKMLLMEREAYEKGYAAGEKAGFEMGQGKANLLLNRLVSIIDELSYCKDKYYSDKEMEFVDIIVRAAEKVVKAELSVNRDVVVNVVKAALNSMIISEKLTIKINPDDMEYLLKERPDFLKNLQNVRGFVVERDSSIGKGGCIVESKYGEVDANTEEGLKVIGKELREAVKK